MFGHGFRVNDSFDEAPGPSSDFQLAPVSLPSVTGSLFVHFCADVGVTVGGGMEVTAWEDQGTGGWSVTPTGTGPTFNATGINGRPAIEWSVASTEMNNLSIPAGAQMNGRTEFSTFTVFAAADVPTGISGGKIWTYDNSGVGNVSLQDQADVNQVILNVRSSAGGQELMVHDYEYAGGGFLMAHMRAKIGDSPPSKSRVQDATKTDTFLFSPTSFGEFPVGRFRMGTNDNRKIAEIMCYDTQLSLGDVDLVLQYLEDKYSLGLTI